MMEKKNCAGLDSSVYYLLSFVSTVFASLLHIFIHLYTKEEHYLRCFLLLWNCLT